ncbi:YitT family protein, partial [Catenibacterium mitsuokai]
MSKNLSAAYKTNKRYIITFFSVLFSALLQTFVLQTFLNPSDLLSSGFTGIAILINRISMLYGYSLSISTLVIVLNLPVAIVCYKTIGKKFVFFSFLQVLFFSIFTRVLSFDPLFDDVILNVCFGGFLYGFAIAIALRGNASTAGTDFIALYVSNKMNKSIFEYIFVFNTLMLCVFGFMFGWIHAGYSILFQFLSTKTIDTFYKRYKRVTLEITTIHPEELRQAYIAQYRHGLTMLHG